jgi:uncharacterized RDD family membrane protein YckC
VTNQQLTEYINSELSKGFSAKKIQKELVENGFDELQVNNIFSSLSQTVNPSGPPTEALEPPQQANQIPDNNRPSDISIYEYAGFWTRFLSYSIDTLIVFFIFMPAVILLFVFKSSSILTLVILIFSLFIEFFYYHHFWCKNGQTIGNRLLAVKVIKSSSPIDLKTSILRYVGYLISRILWNLPFLLVGIDSQKQGLHDKLAGTYVVKTEQKPHLVFAILIVLGPVILAVGAIFISIFLIAFGGNKQSINTQNNKYFANQITNNNKDLTSTIELKNANNNNADPVGNDKERQRDVKYLFNAIYAYVMDKKGTLPATPTTPTRISKSGYDVCEMLVGEYVAALPADPFVNGGYDIAPEQCSENYDTGYLIYIDSDKNIIITAPLAEGEEEISIKNYSKDPWK